MGLKGLLAAAAITIVTVASACTPPPAPGPSPLGENVRFSGLVNGTASNAVIYTACGGPVVGDRVGSVVGGQTVAVRRDAGGDGLTDRAGGVFARTDSSGFVVHITASDTPTKIDGMQVPCEGSGVMVFDPCYGFVGCLEGGHAAQVKVAFVNIAD